MAFDFNDYLNTFNTISEEEFVEKFYTEDLIVESQFGALNGRGEWLATLNFTHIGIREDLAALTIVREGDTIMAETEATFTATEDREDFMYGALKQGEFVKVRFFTVYVLRGDKIHRMAISWWDPKMVMAPADAAG